MYMYIYIYIYIIYTHIHIQLHSMRFNLSVSLLYSIPILSGPILFYITLFYLLYDSMKNCILLPCFIGQERRRIMPKKTLIKAQEGYRMALKPIHKHGDWRVWRHGDNNATG